MRHVTLYTKDGCTLCRGVKATLEELHHEFDFLLQEIDITSDPGLYARYRETIPVVIVASPINRDPVVLTTRITEDSLRRALAHGDRGRLHWLRNVFRF